MVARPLFRWLAALLLLVLAGVPAFIVGAGSGSPSSPAVAQEPVTEEWVVSYDGGKGFGYALKLDGSGNVYVTGTSWGSETGYDYATIRYGPDGTQEWVARYDGPGRTNDSAAALELDLAGNVYVTGRSAGSGTSDDYATIKYGPDGSQQWVARYDGPAGDYDYAYDLAVDPSSNVYVTGKSRGSTGEDYATIKYGPDGSQQWVRRCCGSGTDTAHSVAVDGWGNVYVSGESQSFSNNTEYVTVKYRPDGSQQWVARAPAVPNMTTDFAPALYVDSSGNAYITGPGGSSSNSDFVTVKYGPDGSQQWVARYDGGSWDDAFALTVDRWGNVYVTGESDGDYATVKYGPDGSQQWVARYNDPWDLRDAPRAVAIDASGNVYVTGGSSSAGSPVAYETVKYGADGSQQWVARYHCDAEAWAVAIDGAGNVYVTGYVTIKYVQGAAPGPDLRLQKSDSADPVVATDPFTYTIEVTNIGDTAAADTTVVDQLPDGVPLLWALWTKTAPAGQGVCGALGIFPPCKIGQLDPGASAWVTLAVGAPNVGEETTITNQASVSATVDVNPGNNADTETTTVLPMPCPGDRDCDGMPDSYESAHACLNRFVPDADVDSDGGGLTNIEEKQYGTDPCALPACHESPRNQLNPCDLQRGDILLSHNFLDPVYFLEEVLFNGYWSHAAIYQGDGVVTEALGDPGVVTHRLVDQSGLWTSQDWAILRVNATAAQREAASTYAMSHNGDPYNWIYPNKDPENTFYCSQLVWRAYVREGIDLDSNHGALNKAQFWHGPWGTVGSPLILMAVPPDDIYYAADKTVVKMRPGIMVALRRALLEVLSPGDLYVTDPQGRHTGVDPVTGDVVEEIPDAVYSGPGAEPQFIAIQDMSGPWQVQIVGHETGAYTLAGDQIDIQNHSQPEVEGSIEPGAVDSYVAVYPQTPSEGLQILVDTEGDGMPDAYEEAHSCLDPGAADSLADPDGDGLSSLTEYRLYSTDPCVADTDGDGALDGPDNCPLVANPGQENADSGPPPSGAGGIGNGTGIAGDDATVPNGDPWGDACDDDMDNDGIGNASDPDPGGDITYDDNNNGIPCPTDAADDGPSWDHNCNGIRDGVEATCPLAVNPNGDDDGDGLKNTWEVCKWGTDPAVVDSDGDMVGDCTEAVDTDGNGIIDYGGDALNSARATLLPAGIGPGKFGKDGDFDLNGNNVLAGDYGADTLTVARFTLGIWSCK